MPTERQLLGSFGERRVVHECLCPRCKRSRTLVKLPNNFKCADVICDFCGYLAQVKTVRVRNVESVPNAVLGAAWGPQKTAWPRLSISRCFWFSLGSAKLPIRFFIFPPICKCQACFSQDRPCLQRRDAQDGRASFTTSARCVIALFASVERETPSVRPRAFTLAHPFTPDVKKAPTCYVLYVRGRSIYLVLSHGDSAKG
jgi:hypothetical protein